MEENYYRLSVLNVPPPRIQMDLPVRKKIFGTGRKRYIDHHFVMSFSLRECISRQNRKSLYPGKTGMRISGQVYYTKNYKKTDFTNLGYLIRGEIIDPSGKPQFEFEGGTLSTQLR